MHRLEEFSLGESKRSLLVTFKSYTGQWKTSAMIHFDLDWFVLFSKHVHFEIGNIIKLAKSFATCVSKRKLAG